MNGGTFYCVGVGPDEPELLTLRAVRVLERCGVIAYPETRGGRSFALDIAAFAVDLSGKEELALAFPMAQKGRKCARRVTRRPRRVWRCTELLRGGCAAGRAACGGRRAASCAAGLR